MVNGGTSWSSPITVNADDATVNDNFLPWMDVKSDGTIDIVWYDRRNDVAKRTPVLNRDLMLAP